MLLTILFSLLAGAAVKPMQPQITEFLWRRIDESRLPDEAGRRLIAFAVTLSIAALLLTVLDMPRPVVVMLGLGLVGYFQAEIREALISQR